MTGEFEVLTAVGMTMLFCVVTIVLMMETVSTSETSVNFYETTRRNIPEGCHLHTRHHENMKSQFRIHSQGIYNPYFLVHLFTGPRLRKFDNRLCRRIFGNKRDEVTGRWRKLCNEELHGLYSSTIIIRMIKSRRIRWVGHITRIWEMRNAYKILVVKPEGKT
jgi:hypothetical protein